MLYSRTLLAVHFKHGSVYTLVLNLPISSPIGGAQSPPAGSRASCGLGQLSRLESARSACPFEPGDLLSLLSVSVARAGQLPKDVSSEGRNERS